MGRGGGANLHVTLVGVGVRQGGVGVDMSLTPSGGGETLGTGVEVVEGGGVLGLHKFGVYPFAPHNRLRDRFRGLENLF